MSLTIARPFALAATAALALASCGGSTALAVKLDGSPRSPDAEGVLMKASAEGLTLDGGRNYKVSNKLVTFSTYAPMKPIALRSMLGDYVHVGLKKGVATWIGRVGVVIAADTGRKSVVYQGDLVRFPAGRLEFKDGTVLRLAPGLKAPKDASGTTIVSLNPTSHFVEGATFSPAAK